MSKNSIPWCHACTKLWIQNRVPSKSWYNALWRCLCNASRCNCYYNCSNPRSKKTLAHHEHHQFEPVEFQRFCHSSYSPSPVESHPPSLPKKPLVILIATPCEVSPIRPAQSGRIAALGPDVNGVASVLQLERGARYNTTQ